MRTCSIAGATGCYASFINGIYRATSDLSNGHLVYARDEVATIFSRLATIKYAPEAANANAEKIVGDSHQLLHALHAALAP
jgi:hypothetical protein